jgi:hypothetical protein
MAGTLVKTSYTSLPVAIPDDFLAPLPDPSVITTQKIDFQNTTLPEYKGLYAVVLDNILSKEECDGLIRMCEMSAGGHQEGTEVPKNGWKPALVNAGDGYEYMVTDYRNSDRIIWDEKVVANRLWERVLQGEGIKDYLSVLDGEAYFPVLGYTRPRSDGQRWVVTKQGVNERLRFLKYGAGQYFRGALNPCYPSESCSLTPSKAHCDGTYITPDGKQRTFYTLHLYLNDSEQALGISQLSKDQTSAASKVNPAGEPLRGGATTFHSLDMDRRLDVDPKAGRILIFQHKRLLHSGDDVISGIKYTMRSDLLYELDGGGD